MKIGDVFWWNTDKAEGHDSRWKMHIYICEGNWRAEGYGFLFINKSDYGGDYKIFKNDGFPFLDLEYSYIGVGGLLFYTAQEIRDAKPKPAGVVPKAHLGRLYSAVADSDTMDGWQITLTCGALKGCL